MWYRCGVLVVLVALLGGATSGCALKRVIVVPEEKGKPTRAGSVTILRLKKRNSEELDDSRFTAFLNTHFQRIGYNIVERENLQLLLKEQKISASDLVQSEETRARVGELSGVETLIIGTIGTEYDESRYWPYGVSVDLRALDLNGGEHLINVNATFWARNRHYSLEDYAIYIADELAAKVNGS